MAQRFKYVLSRKIQNDLISKHNGYKGGDLDVPIIPNTVTQQSTEQPATPTPATPTTPPATPASTLPETAQDWKDMSNEDLLKLTPKDINNLSDASFTLAFTSIAPLGNLISSAILSNHNNPNHLLLKATIEKRINILEFWVPPNDPQLKSLLTGIPSFWFQHPNKYTRSKSQNVMYHAYQDFQDTSFYTKFNSRIKAITPPRKFARYMNSGIPGNERNSMGGASSQQYLDDVLGQYAQKWRILFFQGDLTGQMQFGNDYYVYYIDCTGLPDYLDMLQEFYNDRDTVQPQEVIIMLGTKYRIAVQQHEAQLIAKGYSAGEADQKAKDDAAQEAAKQTSDDSSDSIWGDIGSIALDVLPLLL